MQKTTADSWKCFRTELGSSHMHLKIFIRFNAVFDSNRCHFDALLKIVRG